MVKHRDKEMVFADVVRRFAGPFGWEAVPGCEDILCGCVFRKLRWHSHQVRRDDALGLIYWRPSPIPATTVRSDNWRAFVGSLVHKRERFCLVSFREPCRYEFRQTALK